MNKYLCLIISLLLALMGMSALAEGEEVWEFDDYDFYLKKYNGTAAEVVVPDTIQNCAVITIADNAFSGVESMTSLVLPETVLDLKYGAVTRCPNLTSVTLPQSLRILGENSFTVCEALEEITIPSKVCYIGNGSFLMSDNLTKVTFEGECPVFGGQVFQGLSEDLVIYAPDDQVDAYIAAFEAMGNPLNVQPSGKNAIPAEPEFEEGSATFDAETGTLTLYQGFGVRVDVPETIGGVPVKAIGPEAFKNNRYMTYLSLPEGLETIGENAFEATLSLSYVKFPSTLKTIGNSAFSSGYRGVRLDLNEGLETIGDNAFSYCAIGGDLNLPEGVKNIGSGAFATCGMVKNISLPSTVETIGAEAFKDSGAGYMAFDVKEIPEIDPTAFAGCMNISDIDLNYQASKQAMLELQGIVDNLGMTCAVWRNQNPNVDYTDDSRYVLNEEGSGFLLSGYEGEAGNIRPWDSYTSGDVSAKVLGMADGAFQGNTAIRYFSVPYNNVFTTIGAEAFAESTVEYVDLFDSVTTIGDSAFRGCTNLQEIVIPESVTSIGAGIFEGCTGLKKVTVKCDISLLPEGIFEGCTALEEAVLPAGDIPARAFAGTALKTFDLTGVQTIGAHAFEQTALTEADLSAVTAIGDYAFAGSTLTEADLSAVQTVGASAFENALLQTAVLGDTIQTIGENAFAGTQLTEFVIPAHADVAYSAVSTLPRSGLRLSAEATDEQLAEWTEALEYPWYDGMVREGEPSKFAAMPFTATPESEFDFNPETGYIMSYLGDAVDVVIPRTIGGVPVTGIDYNAFERARDYTDTDTMTDRTEWLHLRTVVVPETVTTIIDNAFSYCQQLENFICYGPLEETGKSTFLLCRNLKNVVYVNGVRTIGSYCFDTCSSLENMYFGEHVDEIQDRAFREAGMTEFVVDAKKVVNSAFWHCPNLTKVHFTDRPEAVETGAFNECSLIDEVCYETKDLSFLAGDGAMSMPSPKIVIHLPEGMTDDEQKMVNRTVMWLMDPIELVVDNEPCTRETAMPDVVSILAEYGITEGEAPQNFITPEPSAEEPAEEAGEATIEIDVTPYLGVWYVTTIEMDGEQIDPASMGMDMQITLNEDGTAKYEGEGECMDGAWEVVDGIVIMDGQNMTLNENGAVLEQDGAQMMLSREPAADAPAEDAPAEEAPAEEVPAEEVPAEEVPAEEASEDGMADRYGKLYVCTTVESSGYTLDAASSMGEYAMTFYEDGTMNFVMSGAEVAGLSWSYGEPQEDGAISVVIDYYGTPFTAVVTEEGFDMVMAEVMLMHYELGE